MNTYITILQEQRKLGHNSIFYCFFHTLWVNKQTEYRNYTKLPNNKQQAFCAVKAISITIIKFVRELWLIRNQHIHDPQPAGVTTFKRQQLLTDICHLYTFKQGIQETDRVVLPSQYLQRATTKKNKSLDLFLQRNKEIIKNSQKEMKEQTREYPVPRIPPQILPPPEPNP